MLNHNCVSIKNYTKVMYQDPSILYIQEMTLLPLYCPNHISNRASRIIAILPFLCRQKELKNIK